MKSDEEQLRLVDQNHDKSVSWSEFYDAVLDFQTPKSTSKGRITFFEKNKFDILNIRASFLQIDSDNNNQLDFEELKQALEWLKSQKGGSSSYDLSLYLLWDVAGAGSGYRGHRGGGTIYYLRRQEGKKWSSSGNKVVHFGRRL